LPGIKGEATVSAVKQGSAPAAAVNVEIDAKIRTVFTLPEAIVESGRGKRLARLKGKVRNDAWQKIAYCPFAPVVLFDCHKLYIF
jgi:hypothetical protein